MAGRMDRAIDVRVDERQLARVRRELAAYPGALKRVVPRAINKVAAGARTQIVRGLAGELTLTQKRIRDRVGLRRASYRRWLAELTIGGRRYPLSAFRPRQTRKGLTLRLRRGEARMLIRHAFLARGRTPMRRAAGADERRPLTYDRAGDADRDGDDALVGRLPILRLLGPRLTDVADDVPELGRAVLDQRIATRLAKEIDRQVGVEVERRRR